MEEDIKILEELRKKLGLYANGEKIKQGQALENLIKGYREKEESEKYLYDAYQDAGKKMFEYAEQLEDSVPKSKIKEKIEPVINSLEKDGFVGYADELRDIMSELMEDK